MADWLEFNGVLSTTHGVYMLEPPPITLAAERVRTVQVPGRDGDLEIPDNAYDPIPLPVLCYCRDTTHLDAVAAWLRGRGWLRFGHRPSEQYMARAVLQTQLDKVERGRENRTFEVMFDCQPHRYIYPAASDIVKTVSGESFTNPGNAPSEPRLKIEGTGNFWVAIGTQLMTFEGVTDGIIVDTEMMDVFNLAGTALLNDLATMDNFPSLASGANILTWSGDVTKITITPRWRNI